MERLSRIVEVPSTILHVFACGVTLLMMVHIMLDVIAKYAFNMPIEGTLETVAAYYMVVAVFSSLAYVTRREGHILVELFTRKLSARRIAGIDAVMGIVTIAFTSILTWKTFEDAVHATRLGEIWETGGSILAIWPSRWMLPLGFGLMTAFLMLRMVQDFQVASLGKKV